MFAKRKTELPEVNFDIPVVNVARPLSDKARAIVEAGLSEIASMTVERDSADAERKKALELVNHATTNIRMMQQEIDNLKGRCTSYQLERDEAVAKFAKLQALFTSFFAQMTAFEIPGKQPHSGGFVVSSTPLPGFPAPDLENEIALALNLKGGKTDAKRSTPNGGTNLVDERGTNDKKG